MSIEEDELTALRSAALATLSMKPQNVRNKTSEEDLTTLRQAALMTRKQNQIEVIRRPVEQKTTFTGWVGGGQQIGGRGPIYRPESGIPLSPPQNNNIRFIQPPRSFPQRPPLFFSPPKTSWGTNNLIHLTPGPAAPVPLMSLPRHVNFVRPLLPFPIAPRQPQRAPTHHNFRVHTRGVRPNSDNRSPWSNRPVRHAVTKVRTGEPQKPPQNPPEAKVPDKFSRYDPDSTSDDDDDERATVESKKQDDESDAESEASHKSFSSVSAKSEGEENAVTDEDDQDDHNNAGEAKDAISFVNEEDGILAAIDEFLDEKIEPRPDVTSQKSKAKTARAKPLKTHKSTLRTEKTQGAATNSSNTDKKTKQAVSKGKKSSSVNDKTETLTTRDTMTTIDTKSSSLASSRPEIDPVGEWDDNFNIKDRLQRDIKKTKVPKTKKDVLLQNKEKSEQMLGAAELQRPKKTDRPITPITVCNVPAIEPSQALATQHMDMVELPLTEQRQRRNSDLDSVGSSDLSFLSSSESENEISKAAKSSPKQPIRHKVANSSPKQPVRHKMAKSSPKQSVRLRLVKNPEARDKKFHEKLKERGKKIAKNHDFEPPEMVRKQHIRERIGLREKHERNLLDSEGKTPKTTCIDLRAKLKRDTSKKADETQARSVDLREKIKHRIKVNSNTETMPTSKQTPIIRKTSPITVKSDRIPPEKKSATINLTSKSQGLLSKARNIVITRKRTPSPIRECDSIRIDARKPAKIEEQWKRSTSSHLTGVAVKRTAEKDTKRALSQNSKVRKIEDSGSTEGNVYYGSGVSRKSTLKDAPISPKVLRQRTPSKTSESEAESGEVDDVDILDIHEYDDMLFDIDGDDENAVSSVQKLVTLKSRKRSVDTRTPETFKDSSSENMSEGELAEETKPSSKHAPLKKRNVSIAQKQFTLKSRKRSANTREPQTFKDNSFENESEDDVEEETKFSSKHAPLKKRNVKRRKTDLKQLPKKGLKSVEIREREYRHTHKPTSGNTNETRHVLLAPKHTQDDRTKQRESKRDLKSSSLTTEKYGKNSMKKRIGSRVVVKKNKVSFGNESRDSKDLVSFGNEPRDSKDLVSFGNESRDSKDLVSFGNESCDSKDFDSNSDDGWRPVKPRKVVKTKRKKKSSNKDDRLEARIQRIKKQNGLILRRQQEIQFEKEKFG